MGCLVRSDTMYRIHGAGTCPKIQRPTLMIHRLVPLGVTRLPATQLASVRSTACAEHVHRFELRFRARDDAVVRPMPAGRSDLARLDRTEPYRSARPVEP